ncbi:MAG: flavin reductase family protein [Acidimicrobiales bacterium]
MTARASSPPERVTAEDFKESFRRLAAPVSVVTYLDARDNPMGVTATSMCPLSVDPPSLLICVNRTARSHGEITANGRYGVNLLSSTQQEVAERCSRPGLDKHQVRMSKGAPLPQGW